MKPKLASNYQNILSSLKQRIHSARQNAVISVNVQLLQMYWEIGQTIAEQEKDEGWGTKVVETLSKDLLNEFPDMKGLSVRNLRYMRNFALAYPQFSILQAPLAKSTKSKKAKPETSILQVPLAKLTWYHHITLLDKVKEDKERLFYIAETIKHGWSRNVMVHQIDSGLYERQGKAITNFDTTLAIPNSELAQQLFKDPYKFEFVYLEEQAKERDLEDALTNQITKFLLELGQWFAFVGRQYKMKVGENEYYYDLLFYHTRLKRYIIIDLKIDEFKPEYAGKMNFYLNVADQQLKHEGDGESIGLILCKTKDGLVAEYALRDMNKPMGVAEYKINKALPKDIKGELPTISDIEKRMEEELQELETPAEKRMKRIQQLIAKLDKGEIKDKVSEKRIAEIFETVILPLKHKLQSKFADTIADQFETAQWAIYIGNTGYYSEEEACERFKKATNLSDIGIDVNFKGFKRAGVEAFSAWNAIHFYFAEYYYSIGKDRGDQQNWVRMLYHQTPTVNEVNQIADDFCDVIYGKIEQELNRIINSK